ncbi:hypothetical protein A3B32_03515 [Candidatus Uhrbacteria bacterium RIFCSPLOWO2_01_FULL_53_9]|uniref:Long-chain-fatty-acyl-CoA reductase n=1 Tax=Candidatus Uhrbacteria bacterium RIFCSPLOWO2_01_FULL_53_9 TaxID=1802403 RepID=A0A1F7UYS0_9BACT|nr:MAG: hypothetical protein A3B32_03515 [Candidatus Uhrbacteria bacterium RIFCSPLOWO2_01_FULL_53_9]
MERRLIFHGGVTDHSDVDLHDIVNDLRERREYMHHLEIDEIIAFFHAVISYWSTCGMAKKKPYLKNISDFFEKDHLETSLRIALHSNKYALDRFVDLEDPSLLFHAQPRGLTVHWLAGNVSVLGLFSIFSALLTKNVCLVKASFRGYEDLIELLHSLTEVRTDHIDGKEFTKSVAVVLVEREDMEAHHLLSMSADVRVAWGSFEAIETITSLKRELYCEDIIFGPKYSYALIDNDSLKKDAKRLAQRLAIDVSVFDQYACSSPHTVFVEEKQAGEAEAFAEVLAGEMDRVHRTMLPKGEIDSGKAMEIIELRTRYEMMGRVFHSEGTEWTVVYTQERGLAKGSFSRVIAVVPIQDLSEVGAYNDRQKQTLGLGLSKEHKMNYLDEMTRLGIDRCPDLGYMTFYESPWDGMFVFDRLVRWVTMHKPI